MLDISPEAVNDCVPAKLPLPMPFVETGPLIDILPAVASAVSEPP